MFAPALNPVTIRFAAQAATSLTSVSLAAFLVREAWKCLPKWIREDEVFRSLGTRSSSSSNDDMPRSRSTSSTTSSRYSIRASGSKDASDDDEMASLKSLFNKLSLLIDDGYRKLNRQGRPVEMTTNQLHAAVLASVQMAWQFRKQFPEERDLLYSRIGLPATAADVAGLTEALQFAILAYEEDTEVLCTALDEVAFDLVQHRTADKPGHVGHFIATNPERKLMIIGLKGTSSFGEVLTDCCGRVVPYDLTEQSPDYVDTDETMAVEVHPHDVISSSSAASSSVLHGSSTTK